MAYQSQDIIRRSATNGFTPAPRARDHQEEVAKLIDVTTCIGCKACQVLSFSMPTASSTSSPSSVLAVATVSLAARSTCRDLTRKTTACTNVRCALTA